VTDGVLYNVTVGYI